MGPKRCFGPAQQAPTRTAQLTRSGTSTHTLVPSLGPGVTPHRGGPSGHAIAESDVARGSDLARVDTNPTASSNAHQRASQSVAVFCSIALSLDQVGPSGFVRIMCARFLIPTLLLATACVSQ